MRRSELGYAVLLSVPVGVGVALAVYQTTGDFPGNPLAVGGALLTIAVIFSLVVLGVRGGPDAPESGDGLPDGEGE